VSLFNGGKIMAEKKAKTTAPKAKNYIPDVGMYVIDADPGDPTSRSRFTPGKLSISKDDGGMFKLKLPGGKGKTTLCKEIEAIFLVTYPESECRCTTKADTRQVVCRSYDRVHSTKGFKCADECPFEELGVTYEKKRYKRPLRKRTFLLVREAGTDPQYLLVKFESSLNAIQKVDNVKNIFHQVLKAEGKERPYPSSNVALLSADTEKTEKGFVLGVISPKVATHSLLTEEEATEVAAISKKLLALNKEFMDSYKERTTASYETLVKNGLAGVTNHEKLKALEESSKTGSDAAKPASESGSTAQPDPDSAVQDAEDLIGPSEDDDDDDDDTPF